MKPKFDPASAVSRFADLQKQGFMKPRKVRKPVVEQPIVACQRCQDWHRKGKHTKRIVPKKCCNGCDAPVQPPSKVLCAMCFARLDAKFSALGARFAQIAQPNESEESDDNG